MRPTDFLIVWLIHLIGSLFLFLSLLRISFVKLLPHGQKDFLMWLRGCLLLLLQLLPLCCR